jgi:hypothetical protein
MQIGALEAVSRDIQLRFLSWPLRIPLIELSKGCVAFSLNLKAWVQHSPCFVHVSRKQDLAAKIELTECASDQTDR